MVCSVMSQPVLLKLYWDSVQPLMSDQASFKISFWNISLSHLYIIMSKLHVKRLDCCESPPPPPTPPSPPKKKGKRKRNQSGLKEDPTPQMVNRKAGCNRTTQCMSTFLDQPLFQSNGLTDPVYCHFSKVMDWQIQFTDTFPKQWIDRSSLLSVKSSPKTIHCQILPTFSWCLWSQRGSTAL